MSFFGFIVPKILLSMLIFNTLETIFMASSKRWWILASDKTHVPEIQDTKTYLNSNHIKQYSQMMSLILI